MTDTKSQTIAKWLVILKNMTAEGSDKITAEKLKIYTVALDELFPEHLFTFSVAEQIAAKGDFFPAWATLKASLVEIQAAMTPRLPGTKSPGWLADRIVELSGDLDYYAKMEHERQTRIEERNKRLTHSRTCVS